MPRKSAEEVILAQIASLQDDLREVRRNQRWTCPYCSKTTRVRDLDVVKHYWYDTEFNGIGDVGWQLGGYYTDCRKCGHRVSISEPAWLTPRLSLFNSVSEDRPR